MPRMRAGSGMARNRVSQSRSTREDSGVKPRIVSGAGAFGVNVRPPRANRRELAERRIGVVMEGRVEKDGDGRRLAERPVQTRTRPNVENASAVLQPTTTVEEICASCSVAHPLATTDHGVHRFFRILSAGGCNRLPLYSDARR